MCFASFLVIIFRVDDKFAVVESSLYWSIGFGLHGILIKYWDFELFLNFDNVVVG